MGVFLQVCVKVRKELCITVSPSSSERNLPVLEQLEFLFGNAYERKREKNRLLEGDEQNARS